MSAEHSSRIARIGLALELEDGTMVKLYTDKLGPAATATIDTETETVLRAYDGSDLRRVVTGHQTTITLADLSSYELQIIYPPRPELEGQQAIEAPALRGASLTKAGDGTGTIALEEAPHE